MYFLHWQAVGAKFSTPFVNLRNYGKIFQMLTVLYDDHVEIQLGRNMPIYSTEYFSCAVANPGFPIGGACTRWGGMDLRCGHFLVKMYVKTKELGPIGGRVLGTHPP